MAIELDPAEPVERPLVDLYLNLQLSLRRGLVLSASPKLLESRQQGAVIEVEASGG